MKWKGDFGMSIQKDISKVSEKSDNKRARTHKIYNQSFRMLELYRYLGRVEGILIATFSEEMEVTEETVKNDVLWIKQFIAEETTLNKKVIIEGTTMYGSRRIRIVNPKTSTTPAHRKSKRDYRKTAPYRRLKFQKVLEQQGRIDIGQWVEQEDVCMKTVERDIKFMNKYYRDTLQSRKVGYWGDGYCELVKKRR